jgi:hypothetical protein
MYIVTRAAEQYIQYVQHPPSRIVGIFHNLKKKKKPPALFCFYVERIIIIKHIKRIRQNESNFSWLQILLLLAIFPIRLELLINHVIGRAGSFSNYKQQQQQRQNLNKKNFYK